MKELVCFVLWAAPGGWGCVCLALFTYITHTCCHWAPGWHRLDFQNKAPLPANARPVKHEECYKPDLFNSIQIIIHIIIMVIIQIIIHIIILNIFFSLLTLRSEMWEIMYLPVSVFVRLLDYILCTRLHRKFQNKVWRFVNDQLSHESAEFE